MATPNNSDIMRVLGELAEGMRGVRRELDDAKNSRRIMYESIEAQNIQIANVRFETEKQTGILAQTREEVKGLHAAHKAMNDDIAPLLNLKTELPAVVEVWRDMSKWSRRVVYLLGIGGVSVVGFLYWFGGIITKAVQHWLGIPPGN